MEQERRFEPHVKLTIRADGHGFFGPGVAELMERIRRCGSVKDACRDMGMSYSKGRYILRRAEEALSMTLVLHQHGGAGGGAEHAGEGVGHVQDLEQALDAAVLAVVAVHRDVGDVVAARGEALHKVDVGHVHQVYLGKPCLEQRLLAGAARLHRDVALVRPAAGQHDYLACKYVFLCHEKPFSCTRVRLYQRFGNVR